MKIRYRKPDDYTVSNWSGGKTIQLAIGPEGAVYADRNFLWRVSSATVESAESDYTALPDYDRWITPLEGEMKLSHNGGTYKNIEVLEPYFFDGADATHCIGVCTDFNLMLRKGSCSGQLCGLRLGAAEEKVISSCGDTLLIYCFAGEAEITAAGQKRMIEEKSSVLAEDAQGQQLSVRTEKGAVLVIAGIQLK